MSDTLGGRIADLLVERKMTQRDLAKRVKITEVSMSRYISNDRVPNASIVASIANVLDTTSDYLLTGTIRVEGNDAEEEYYTITRLVERNLQTMTSKQKKFLIRTILESL